jgi:hypothetical protein
MRWHLSVKGGSVWNFPLTPARGAQPAPLHPTSPSLAYPGGVSGMIAVVETSEFLDDVKGVL